MTAELAKSTNMDTSVVTSGISPDKTEDMFHVEYKGLQVHIAIELNTHWHEYMVWMRMLIQNPDDKNEYVSVKSEISRVYYSSDKLGAIDLTLRQILKDPPIKELDEK